MRQQNHILGFGLGLRSPHIAQIKQDHPNYIDWFEIISENYIEMQGIAHQNLEAIKEHYPVILHGVSLSIGTIDTLNSEYLTKLKKLADWVNPAWVSDHLCWTGIAHQNTHDLLPVPYTEEALAHIVARIKQVQDYLGRRLIFENPSTYLEFASSYMPEEEFLSRMSEESGCGLLLDVNNIYVSCYNHKRDPKSYIDALPLDHVYQIHLAGHTNKETHIIDTHNGPVIDEVWQLYKYVIHKAGFISTMIEWDDDIPPLSDVVAELDKARKIVANIDDDFSLPKFSPAPHHIANQNVPLNENMSLMQGVILNGLSPDDHLSWIKPKQELTQAEQIQIYAGGYRERLISITLKDYPFLEVYVGPEKMRRLVGDFVNKTPSPFYDTGRYPALFYEFLLQQNIDDHILLEIAEFESVLSATEYKKENQALCSKDINNFDISSFLTHKVEFVESLSIHSFSWNVFDCYNHFLEKKELCSLDKIPSHIAVFYKDGKVWRLELEALEKDFILSLLSHSSFEEALDYFIEGNSQIDPALLQEKLSTWFSTWLSNGILKAPEIQTLQKSA